MTSALEEIICDQLQNLSSDYTIKNNQAVHSSTIIEKGAVLKGPMILGPHVFVAANAYLRGGIFLDDYCIVGPSCELKTTMMFEGSKVAHLSFVGDSILGSRANIEAGAMIANYRNEMDDKEISFFYQRSVIKTGVDKFGSLIGDDCRIGANAVIAPGALLDQGYKLVRGGLLDFHPYAIKV